MFGGLFRGPAEVEVTMRKPAMWLETMEKYTFKEKAEYGLLEQGPRNSRKVGTKKYLSRLLGMKMAMTDRGISGVWAK